MTNIQIKSIAKNGFTLIELLIVISILGILASIALVAFSSAQTRGRDAQRKSNLTEVSHALELFYADYGIYPKASGVSLAACPYTPSSPATWSPCTWGTSEFRDTDAAGSATKTTYLKTLPKDPVSGSNYLYVVSTDGSAFQLFAHLENTQDTSINNAITTSCGGSHVCNFGISSPNTSPTATLN